MKNSDRGHSDESPVSSSAFLYDSFGCRETTKLKR